MNIAVHGINFKRAPVRVRERIALSPEDMSQMLHIIRKRGLADESMILSTCNRTEFYLAGCFRKDALDHLLGCLGEIKAEDPSGDRSLFYTLSGREAVRHLFRTGASLDSQMPGETEILGQVKAAYRLALDAGTARFQLNRTLHQAFRAAKRVFSETALCRGAASIPSAAVEMLKLQIGGLEKATILVVGAGKTAGTALRVLAGCGVSRGFCANRNLLHAERMLKRMRDSAVISHSGGHHPGHDRSSPSPHPGGEKRPASGFGWEAVPLNALADIIGRVDGVISATGAAGTVLKHAELGGAISRRTEPLCIVDIAVPRDVDPSLGELPAVCLKTIDDLDEVIARSKHRRMAELPKAEAIVEEEVEKFFRWADALRVAPTIKKLNDYAARQRELEIRRRSGADAGGQNPESLSQFADALCAKLLHRPFEYLNRVSSERSESDLMAALDIIHEMFGLDEHDTAEDRKS